MFDEPVPDVRQNLWDIARTHAHTKAPQRSLMALLCWLWYTHGIRDLEVLKQVACRVRGAKNPRAYFNPDHKAIGALIGEMSTRRAELAAEAERDADRRAGLTKRG